jgi:DNA-binding transcriptional regulator/RsmH inhibitor MraZ
MFIRLDDDNLINGFCWKVYEVTVDNGPRIRLPAVINKTLKQFNVKTLWIYRDVTGPRLILCPEQNRKAYIKAVKENLPSSMKWDKAYRVYICTGETIGISGHGRVPLLSRFTADFKAIPGQQIVILGTGLWYELWLQDDWYKHCEATSNQ